jgi:hypothetical protein
MGPLTAHLISVFAARAPLFCVLLGSSLLAFYGRTQIQTPYLIFWRVRQRAPSFRALLEWSFWHCVVVLKSRCLISAFVVRAPACALICGLLGESVPTFYGLNRAQIPHLRICSACHSMRLHFVLYWTNRFPHFSVALKSRCLSSPIVARAPVCAFILCLSG